MKNKFLVSYIFNCIFAFLLMTIASNNIIGSEIKSVRAYNPPVIDGKISPSEWNFANTKRDPIAGGFLVVENDSNNLYLLVDLTKTANLKSDEDEIEQHGFLLDKGIVILIDTNRDKKIKLLDDLGYLFYPIEEKEVGGVKLRYPGFLYDLTYGANISSFTRAKIGLGSGPTPNSATTHFFWEVSIPLAEITDGSKNTIRISAVTNAKMINSEFDTEKEDENPVILNHTTKIMLAGSIFDKPALAASAPKEEQVGVPSISEDGSILLTYPDGTSKKMPASAFPSLSQINAPPALLPSAPDDPKTQQWLKWLGESLLEMISTRLPPGSKLLQELRKQESGKSLYEIVTLRLRYFSMLRQVGGN